MAFQAHVLPVTRKHFNLLVKIAYVLHGIYVKLCMYVPLIRELEYAQVTDFDLARIK